MGFTVPEVDKLFEPYATKSYNNYLGEGLSSGDAYKKVYRKFIQGFQALEMKLNSVGSSRGDYPFTTFTFGLGTSVLAKMASKACLAVRAKGQGEPGKERPVLFPKLVFLFDEELHGIGGPLEDVFEAAIKCTSKTMYPDYVSLSGKGYVSDIYQKYKVPIQPMGCRSFVSPWYPEGGMEPIGDEKPIAVGRFNVGVVSLNLPMIYMKAKTEKLDFYKTLDYYLQMIRSIHQRTYEYLGNLRASMNPVAFCEGGFYGGHLGLNDKIAPVLKSATASIGITALHELSVLATGKGIAEDNTFAVEVVNYINKKIDEWKHADGHLYSMYSTPAEVLCVSQVKQFIEKYGVIPGVSDKPYFTNSFHCHVTEDITPFEKQDKEYEIFHKSVGGRIQYVRIDNPSNNIDAIRALVLRGMKKGFYQGINFDACFCEDCGTKYNNGGIACPCCGSTNVVVINRITGYLGYSKIHGKSRINDGMTQQIRQRVSM